jgi:uncharacterized protein YndB with AHSA1/START domain
MSPVDTDRIERTVVLKSPRERVWRALSDAEEFGTWFGVNLAGQVFATGGTVRGHITHPGYEHLLFQVEVERVEPGHVLAFRWHPYAIDTAVDYSGEEPTLVTFTLEDVAGGGTMLRVVESGFDRVPAHRRAEAFRMNSQGWSIQMGNLERHVTTHP